MKTNYDIAISEMKDLFEFKLQEAVKRAALSAEEVTEKQLIEAIRQAILCGDFTRLISADGNSQAVVYLPFSRVVELESRIRELEGEIEILVEGDFSDHDEN